MGQGGKQDTVQVGEEADGTQAERRRGGHHVPHVKAQYAGPEGGVETVMKGIQGVELHEVEKAQASAVEQAQAGDGG